MPSTKTNQTDEIDYSSESDTDLTRYLLVYTEEANKLLITCSEKRDAIEVLNQKGNEENFHEEAITAILTSPEKRIANINRLSQEVAESIQQFKMMNTIINSLLREIEKRMNEVEKQTSLKSPPLKKKKHSTTTKKKKTTKKQTKKK